MKICVLMTPSLSNTDYATTPRSYGKQQGESKCYEGAYDFFLSQQLVPVAIHEPIWLDERTEDRYGEKRGKQSWVVPTVGCIEARVKEEMKWVFPIFRSIEDFEESPMGKWVMKRFKGKWSIENHWNPDKAQRYRNQEWIRETWQTIWDLEKDEYDAFMVCLPIKVYGHQVPSTAVTPDSKPPQGMDIQDMGDGQMRIVPSPRKEVGRFFRTSYPMFVIPTSQTKTPSYHSAGGRYFNIAPMKQLGKTSDSIDDYARFCGYPLSRPVVVGKKPKMKPLTRAQRVLAPRQWFMQQYMTYQSTVFKMRMNAFVYDAHPSYVGHANGNVMKHLYMVCGFVNATGNIPKKNEHNAEILSSLLESYYHPQSPSDFIIPDAFKACSISWPLSNEDLLRVQKKSGMEPSYDIKAETLEHSYEAVSLPPSLNLKELKGGEYDITYWDVSDMGLMNYGFVDFISPTVWDD